MTMSRALVAGRLITAALTATAQAQAPGPPPIVTPQGVTATDPISERRPAKPYIDAIQAVTKAPIKYVIYSHSHFDHIAGGKPFKDMGGSTILPAAHER